MALTQLDDKIAILKKVNIFSETEESVLKEIAPRLTELTIEPEERVIYKGEPGKAMYMIIEGKVKVHDGDHVFSYLTDGMVFGEYSVIDTELRSASVTGVEKTRVYQFSQKDYYELLAENIGFAKGVLKVLTARLRQHDVIQEQLASSNKRIKRQKSEIEEINKELRELNEEKDHLIDLLAHDLRNPLTSSISILDLLKDELPDKSSDLPEYVDRVTKSLWRMNDMISRILDVRAIETKKIILNFEKVRVDRVLADICKFYQPIAAKKDIELHLDTCEGWADLDESYARQVFENLVSNAIKFSPPQKNVWVRLIDEDGALNTEVIDEGPGISPEDQKKLFGKFQRLSAEPTGGESSIGLGLSIVKHYVDEMEGKVWCESNLGKGARFVVIFKQVSRL